MAEHSATLQLLMSLSMSWLTTQKSMMLGEPFVGKRVGLDGATTMPECQSAPP